MSYQIDPLLEGLSEPVTVHIDQPIRSALDLMVQHDFSQLPVIHDGGSKDYFLVTNDSILAALADFGPQSYNGGLFVRDALKRVPRPYRASDDLFDLLEGMHNLSAALIVDEDNGRLTHIVTSYDTTQYFRRWSEAMMHARDIEQSLKQYLREAYKYDDGQIDEASRRSAIESITSSNRELHRKLDRALCDYLKKRSEEAISINEGWIDQGFVEFLKGQVPLTEATPVPGPDQSFRTAQALQESFKKGVQTYLEAQAIAEASPSQTAFDLALAGVTSRNERPKEFKDLTLNEYIQLLFSDHFWQRCESVLTTKENMRSLLEGVRDTRNDLAHFREDEINAHQRQQLKRCADWLAQKKDAVFSVLSNTAQPAPNEDASV